MTRKTYLSGLYAALEQIEGVKDCQTATFKIRTFIMKKEMKARMRERKAKQSAPAVTSQYDLGDMAAQSFGKGW